MQNTQPHNGNKVRNTDFAESNNGLSGKVVEIIDNSTKRDIGYYDLLTRTLHWSFAICIIYIMIAGFSLRLISEQPLHDFLSHLNMSLSTILIILFPIRVIWKFNRVNPPNLPGISEAKVKIGHCMHGVLYLVIFVVLLSGFLMTPHSYPFFGLTTIPTPFEKGLTTQAIFFIHRLSCLLLAGLVAVHILAVIKYQFIDKINIVSRMS